MNVRMFDHIGESHEESVRSAKAEAARRLALHVKNSKFVPIFCGLLQAGRIIGDAEQLWPGWFRSRWLLLGQ